MALCGYLINQGAPEFFVITMSAKQKLFDLLYLCVCDLKFLGTSLYKMA